MVFYRRRGAIFRAVRGRRVRPVLHPGDLHRDVEVVALPRVIWVRLLLDDEDDILKRPVLVLVADAGHADLGAVPPARRDSHVNLNALRLARTQRACNAVVLRAASVELLEGQGQREDPVARLGAEIFAAVFGRAEWGKGGAQVDRVDELEIGIFGGVMMVCRVVPLVRTVPAD